MSFTNTVPAIEPSDFQSSDPLPMPPSAKKYSVPLIAAIACGAESAIPGLMSTAITVPATVPSDFHNSMPLVASHAEK